MKNWPIEGELRGTVLTTLKRSPWFSALDDAQLEPLLGLARLDSFETGEEIVKAGDPADAIFLLMKGSVTFEVTKDGEPVELGRAKAPFTFGEVGLLLGRQRSATVVAAEEVYALRFMAGVFREMFDGVPGFRLSLARAMASRLAELSALVLPEHTKDDGTPGEHELALLPLAFLRRHQVLPLSLDQNLLTIGFVSDPTPPVMASIRNQLPGMELQPVRINRKLLDEVLEAEVQRREQVASTEPATQAAIIEGPAPEIPGKLLELLERTVAEGASDLHLAAGRRPLWRIDGEITIIEDQEPLTRTEVRDLFHPVMEERHRQELEECWDADFALSAPGIGRFRVNLNRTNRGINGALRLIPWQILTLEQLGLPPVLKTFCTQPKGLVLVTGPTGSGKSTTLAAMIDYINRMRKCHLITIEDPIEFVHEEKECLINQREVGSHVKSFGRGLHAALREDPDVVMFGELRDREVTALALEMASTGHLVFSTVHTNSAVATIERIIEMFPGEMQPQARTALADCLRGVVSQTLCRGRAGGRLAAVEVLVGTFAASNIIREAKVNQLQNIMQVGGKEGHRLLNDDLARLVKDRKVLYEEALSKSVDKKDLARRLGKIPAPDPTRKRKA